MRQTLSFALACALCASAPAVDAQLYKWIDDDGVVNYGDWPPWGVKVQPVNHGTLSSVSNRALVAPIAGAPDASKGTSRTDGAHRRGSNVAAPANAPTTPGDTEFVGSDALYDGYAPRAVAVAEADRRAANNWVDRPLLPIHPAIPDMPLRPRR